jgi:2-polyprenyl-6-methoxyphenol hydroxylase-like FAD-dependent oxidoreductase
METTEVPVLIVGGSIVGLAAAMFLNAHGIATLNVERHAGTAIHPRAGHFHLRTLELLRQVGVEQAAIDASVDQFGTGGGINAVESLAGRELAKYISDLNEGVAAISPSRRMFLSQQRLEPLLRRRAEELGAALQYGTELVSFEQDAAGVSAIIRDLTTGGERMVRAAYMIAADGNRSPIRERLGIGMTGPGHLSNSITIYFNADLRPYLKGRDLGVIYVFNADQRGFFRLEKAATSGFLIVSTFGDTSVPGARDVATGITPEKCVALLRSAVGVPHLAVEIVDVAAWKAVAHTADRYAAGRVFLVGDAAHVMPPAGGFGGNTGVHDAHNLAWKLAAVVRGHATPELLDTYETERRPIGVLTVGQAYTRWVRRVDPELGVADAPPVIDDLTMEIGYLHGADALYADPRQHPVPLGARAPHLTLLRDGQIISSLDLFGAGFVLLAGGDGWRWAEAAEQASADLQVPLAVPRLSASGLIDVEGRFATVYGTDDAGAVLIRPDGILAWRSGDEIPSVETVRRELGLALRRIPTATPRH